MSFTALEREIVAEAKAILGNKKFKLKELLEWSSSETKVKNGARENEVVLHLPKTNVWIAVAKENDKRVQPSNPMNTLQDK